MSLGVRPLRRGGLRNPRFWEPPRLPRLTRGLGLEPPDGRPPKEADVAVAGAGRLDGLRPGWREEGGGGQDSLPPGVDMPPKRGAVGDRDRA